MHRSPQHWEEPNRFDPDRNDANRLGAGRCPDRRAFIPFSAGPRQCIGRLFALVEAKVVLARLAQRFSCILQPGRPVRVASSSTQHPEGPAVRFTPRAAQTLAAS